MTMVRLIAVMVCRLLMIGSVLGDGWTATTRRMAAKFTETADFDEFWTARESPTPNWLQSRGKMMHLLSLEYPNKFLEAIFLILFCYVLRPSWKPASEFISKRPYPPYDHGAAHCRHGVADYWWSAVFWGMRKHVGHVELCLNGQKACCFVIVGEENRALSGVQGTCLCCSVWVPCTVVL